MSVGEFLCEKVMNMYAWLSEDGLPHVLNPYMVTPVLATAMAQELLQFEDVIRRRSFEELAEAPIPIELLSVLEYVRKKPALQDKFWRYLQLFSDTVK